MKGRKQKLRRSGAKIMASLILLLGSLAYIMILAVINGSIGFICAMGVTVFGSGRRGESARRNDCAVIRLDNRTCRRLRTVARTVAVL